MLVVYIVDRRVGEREKNILLGNLESRMTKDPFFSPRRNFFGSLQMGGGRKEVVVCTCTYQVGYGKGFFPPEKQILRPGSSGIQCSSLFSLNSLSLFLDRRV